MLPLFLTVLVTSFLTASIVHFATRRPGYSHVRDTISELGERGTRDQVAVSYGVFMPVGIALLGVAWLTITIDPRTALLALCLAAGYFTAAAFPCDPGSPLWGGLRQTMHNLGGAVEYAGGAMSLGALSEVHGAPFRIAMFVVMAALLAISIPALGAVRGLVQRVAETTLFVALAWAAWFAAART